MDHSDRAVSGKTRATWLGALSVGLILSALGVSGCSGPTWKPVAISSIPAAPPREPKPVRRPDSEPAKQAQKGPNPEWEKKSKADLIKLIRDDVAEKLKANAADFDQNQIATYRRVPNRAPLLSGKACDALLNLALVELLDGKFDDAESTIRLVRARAKNRNSAFVGTTVLAESKVRKALGAPHKQADDEVVKTAASPIFDELPRERLGSSTVAYQFLQTNEQIAAMLSVAKESLVSPDSAVTVLRAQELFPSVVKHRTSYLAAVEQIRVKKEKQPPRKNHDFGVVDLATEKNITPVAMAVWDTGTNTALDVFKGKLFENSSEEINGKDDDNNGQIDDRFGIVSDGKAPNTAVLFEPGQEVTKKYAPFLRGVMDLRAGMASTDSAKKVLELMRSASTPQAQRELEVSLDSVGEWAHGTHVGGIMVKGNPAARLAVFRSAWAGEARLYHDRGPTDAELSSERANVDAIAAFINKHKIRVVNASLGFSREYVEAQLRKETGKYKSDAEVKARAKVVHEHRKETWAKVFAACPDTLFVVAAGNSNQDIVEYEEWPGALSAPNLMTIGAVDKFGDWAIFTNSNIDRVKVFHHGVEVDSVIPSGEVVPLSGTSMASPNVANLAGKILAIDPSRKPGDVIKIISDTATTIAAPFSGKIANEAKAIAKTKAEKKP